MDESFLELGKKIYSCDLCAGNRKSTIQRVEREILIVQSIQCGFMYSLGSTSNEANKRAMLHTEWTITKS